MCSITQFIAKQNTAIKLKKRDIPHVAYPVRDFNHSSFIAFAPCSVFPLNKEKRLKLYAD